MSVAQQWENADAITKANFVVSDLTAGGKLVPEQAKTFLKVAIKVSKLLKMINVQTMISPQKELPNIRFGGQVLYGGKNSTPLPVGQRADPNLGKVTLTVQLFKGEVRIEDEVFEDNIERQALNQTILETVAEAVGRDMENAVINGDTTSSNTLLAQFDGFLKQMVSNIVNAGDVKLTKSVLRDLLKTLPIEFRQDKENLKFITSPDAEIDYRDSLGDRQTPGGDEWLSEGTKPVASAGIAVEPIPLFPQNQGTSANETSVVICDPKNLTVGVLRDVKIEPWRDPGAGQVVFAISLRMDAKIAYEGAVAKSTNVRIS